MSKSKLRKVEHSEEKLKYLTLLSDHLFKENEILKVELEDMKMTVLHNKEMLKEYIDNITDKDKIVQKLQCTIENLTERIKTQDEVIKRMINQNKDYVRLLSCNKIAKTEDNYDVNCFDSIITSPTLKTTNITNWGYLMDPKTKEGFNNKQNTIMRELNQLKYDFKYIVEKYEQLCKKNAKKKYEKFCDELNTSSFDASSISGFSTDTVIKKKVNLKKKFENIISLQGLLNKHEAESVLLLIDGNNQVWEIIKRDELNLNNLKNPESIDSLKKKLYLHNDNNFHIDLKENNNTSMNNSYLHTGKNDFNISILLKD